MKVVYFGATWPQPGVTAAGVRTMGLIQCLQRLGHSVSFLTFKKPNSSQMTAISAAKVATQYCPPNDEKALLAAIGQPDICVMERFSTEEMFGHYIFTHFPQCIRILDTQDFHSLRTQREALATAKVSMRGSGNVGIKEWEVKLHGDDKACREVASFLRSDLAVFCSDFEAAMARRKFGVGNEALLTMFYPEEEIAKWKRAVECVEKADFVWIGHFNHPPNQDSLEALKVIWPKIHSRLPNSRLHIYGSHCPPNYSLGLPNAETKGQVQTLSALCNYKVMLAPLRYGAGIKGKITDAWMYGIRVVTTSIGAEGLSREGEFAGAVADDWEEFAEKAVQAHQTDGREDRAKGYEVLRKYFSLEANQRILSGHLSALCTDLSSIREQRPLQQLLWSQSLRASEYFSRYISLKERRTTLSYSPVSGCSTPT